jgi:hypothetical protein
VGLNEFLEGSTLCHVCGVPGVLTILAPCGHIVCDGDLPEGLVARADNLELEAVERPGLCPVCQERPRQASRLG